jgi:hypothetical protein
MKYGNFSLRKGDHDGDPQKDLFPRWGSIDNPGSEIISGETELANNSSSATFTIPEHIKSLQNDLQTLGFSIVGEPDGKFGPSCEWAVREFQIYASMSQVARVRPEKTGQLLLNSNGLPITIENNNVYYDSAANIVNKVSQTLEAHSDSENKSYYVDSLEPVTNGHLYEGPISGVLNSETRNALEFWLENNYRCPVIIEAWTWDKRLNKRTNLINNNLWRHDDIKDSSPRVFFRDFSNYYEYPPTRLTDQYHVLGYYATQAFGGPNASPGHSWSPEASISIENILGHNFDVNQITSPALSTYRVIRVVAEAECYGRFDVLNAWDNALMSAGPCHWTLGIYSGESYKNGEFSAFIAFLKSSEYTAYKKAFGNFGLSATNSWGDEEIYSSNTLTYTSWIKLTNESYNTSENEHNENEFDVLPRSKAGAHYLKSWHWFYRVSMAGRTIENYRNCMWKMAKIRLKAILEKEVSFHINSNVLRHTIRQIYTSEKAIAILLRWHVYRPAHIVSSNNNRLISIIEETIRDARNINWSLPINEWGDTHENELTRRLLLSLQSINNTISTSINFGLNQPQGSVKTGRNSFILEDL